MDPQEGGATWKDTYDVWIDALESNYREVIEGAAGFVPNLISAAILLVVGWLLATGLRFLILRFGTRLDRLFQAARDRLGPAQAELRWPPSRMLAFVVYWLVIVFFLAVVSETLGLPGLSDAFDEILIHLPILVICAVVLFVVYLLSGVAANAVATAARSSGVRNGRLLGRAVTRNCAGTMSSRSLRSSPIFAISPQPQGHSVLSGSITRSIRGRCSGRCPMLRAGAGRSGDGAGFGGETGFTASSSSAAAATRSSKASWRSSAASFSDRLP